MKKTALILCCGLLACALAVATTACTAGQKAPIEDASGEQGSNSMAADEGAAHVLPEKIRAMKDDIPPEDRLLEGEHITVSRSEAEEHMAQNRAMGGEETMEDAIDFLTQREIWYYQALANGYSVTEQEVEDYIDMQMEFSSRASNRDQLDAYLDSLGMTEKEYWQSQKSVLEKELTTSKYTSALQQEFLEEEAFANPYSAEAQSVWQDYQEALYQEFYEQENLTEVAP